MYAHTPFVLTHSSLRVSFNPVLERTHQCASPCFRFVVVVVASVAHVRSGLLSSSPCFCTPTHLPAYLPPSPLHDHVRTPTCIPSTRPSIHTLRRGSRSRPAFCVLVLRLPLIMMTTVFVLHPTHSAGRREMQTIFSYTEYLAFFFTRTNALHNKEQT